MIYVVSHYDMIEFVGINFSKARDAAIKAGVKHICVWKHGKLAYTVDLDQNIVINYQ